MSLSTIEKNDTLVIDLDIFKLYKSTNKGYKCMVKDMCSILHKPNICSATFNHRNTPPELINIYGSFTVNLKPYIKLVFKKNNYIEILDESDIQIYIIQTNNWQLYLDEIRRCHMYNSSLLAYIGDEYYDKYI